MSNQNYIMANAELYIYGEVCDLGGDKIQVKSDDGELYVIKASKGRGNLVPKGGVRVRARQCVITGYIDKRSLELINYVYYNPSYNKEVMEKLVRIGKMQWKGIDADDFINNLRHE